MSAVWVKIISAWMCFSLYMWTLVAPVVLPDRDFSFWREEGEKTCRAEPGYEVPGTFSASSPGPGSGDIVSGQDLQWPGTWFPNQPQNHHPATNCQIILSGEQPRILNSTQLNSYCSQSSTECTLRTPKPKVCTLHTVLTNINVHLLLCIEHICHFTKARTFRFLVDFSRLEAFAPVDSVLVFWPVCRTSPPK